MRYLLDTCVLLWVLEDDQVRLSSFIETLTNPNYIKAVSVVSYWEIVIKKTIGKLKAPHNMIELIENSGFVWIDLLPAHLAQLEHLPVLHQDPFDRVLVAQAKCEQLELLTTDKSILQYFGAVN